MKLSAVVAQYVVYKQSMGMRFHTEARTLQSFCRAMGEISVAEIAPDRVQTYIAGAGLFVTRAKIFWICSPARNLGTLDSDHVAMVGTHVAKSISTMPRWNK